MVVPLSTGHKMNEHEGYDTRVLKEGVQLSIWHLW